MRFTVAISAAALVAGVSAASNGTGIVYVTDVVSYYTTYCPEATQITHGSSTYTVTEATTLTIDDCPCTITRPASSSVAAVMTSLTASSSSASSSAVVAPVSSASSSASVVAPVSSASSSSSVVAPVAASSTPAVVAPIYSNGTVATTVAPVAGTASSGLPSSSSSAPLTHYTGAATKNLVGSGAGLAAVFGLAVYAL